MLTSDWQLQIHRGLYSFICFLLHLIVVNSKQTRWHSYQFCEHIDNYQVHSFIGSFDRNKRLAKRVVDECFGRNMVRLPSSDVCAQIISKYPTAMAIAKTNCPTAIAILCLECTRFQQARYVYCRSVEIKLDNL
jgi:hypothetical protein